MWQKLSFFFCYAVKTSVQSKHKLFYRSNSAPDVFYCKMEGKSSSKMCEENVLKCSPQCCIHVFISFKILLYKHVSYYRRFSSFAFPYIIWTSFIAFLYTLLHDPWYLKQEFSLVFNVFFGYDFTYIHQTLLYTPPKCHGTPSATPLSYFTVLLCCVYHF